ncbi:MAG: ATP phosphoribosyltransferase regulatory subunit [Verrucomicrobiota bacterium]|nr:ATP phosphoribosyltransferase regulatory subunit [Verrucomicrobiota bacterium]
MERLPGFRDFYPEPLPHADVGSADARQFIFQKWRDVARRYNFREYDGPPLEPLELFTTKSGDEIVGQLYNFTDKGSRAVALRPEMTPTLARMAAAHERRFKKPIKWFAVPQLFRYERQQRGRLREHFQFNADILGETGPAADAELIALLIDALRSFGLTARDFVVRLSSRNAWHEFYEGRRSKSGGRADHAHEYNFFQTIDKLERAPPEESDKKLDALGFSMAEVSQFIESGKPTAELETILQNLAARGLSDFVKVDYHVVRGLAYYTGAVFEAFDARGEFRALAGGGRYDNLVKLISGGKVDLPALGFGMGDVVLLELLRARRLLPRFDSATDVFVLIEDEGLRPQSLRLVQDLRTAGYAVEYPFTATRPDKQFKRAQELNATRTARLENADYVRIRDLKTRQEIVAGVADAANHLK